MSNKLQKLPEPFWIYPSAIPDTEWTAPLPLEPEEAVMVSSSGGVFAVVHTERHPEHGMLWLWQRVASFDPASPPGPLPETMTCKRGDDVRRFYRR
jgi:hypothetical protein